jgi:hypothetical protein
MEIFQAFRYLTKGANMTISAINNTSSPNQYSQLRTTQEDQVKAAATQRNDAATTEDTQKKKAQETVVDDQKANDKNSRAVQQGGEIDITA